MVYTILPYSYLQAEKLGVTIKPSVNKKKKIDVFKDGKKVASIGAMGYTDYPHLLEEDKVVAEKRRKAYKARHAKNRTSGVGMYADKILW